MKNFAIQLEKFGSIENLSLQEVPVPIPEDDEVLVKVYCTGISFADILIVEGKYQDTPKLPFIPGLEVSGIIQEVGNNVKNFKVGDEVVGLSSWGGFSEFVKLNSRFIVKNRRDMSFEIAGSMTINYGTSYYALVERAKIRPGQRVLILGASGGIGLSAIEIAKAFECKVTAVASSSDKLLMCKQYGADTLILNDTNNLKESIKKNNVEKFDLIYDTIGGQTTVDSLSCIKCEGKILIIVFASGDIADISVNKILLKGCDLVGIFWGPFAYGNKNFNLTCIEKIGNLYEKGLIKIAAPELYSINDFMKALAKIKNRESIGKLCLYPESYKAER